MTDVTRNTRGLTVKCWNNHALRIFVATLGKMPRFLAFFLLLGSSSSQPSVPSPLPTLALLASPAKRKKITQNYYDYYWILSNFHGKCESSSILHYGKCIVKCSRGGKFLLLLEASIMNGTSQIARGFYKGRVSRVEFCSLEPPKKFWQHLFGGAPPRRSEKKLTIRVSENTGWEREFCCSYHQ